MDQHEMTEDVLGNDRGKGVEGDDSIDDEEYEEDDSSDDSVSDEDIYFNDSEEERMAEVDVRFDDGFNHVFVEPQNGLFDVENHEPERPTRVLITKDMENEHVIEDGYVTDQLDSASENEEPACASNDATNTTSANVPLTQASQTNAPKKRDPNAPKVPKVAKVPNAPKAPKNANAHASQAADETPNAHASQAIAKAPNAHASQVTAEAPNAHGHLIDPDLLADILLGDDDEVPDMLSKRLYCSAPPSIEPVSAKAQPTWDDISKKLTQ
ncbi:hypothetical protein TSUD_143370 [Trifolium subterraneum]|uniref:Uncharacterized protein n=1 Tax=Trifolium subterraneum TaxID=3900 RepID=A0A2Z6MLU4_TRISU|nr:hypothetical protein TSUD_143370 [Trifolium subterraneum]